MSRDRENYVVGYITALPNIGRPRCAQECEIIKMAMQVEQSNLNNGNNYDCSMALKNVCQNITLTTVWKSIEK